MSLGILASCAMLYLRECSPEWFDKPVSYICNER